MLHITTSKGELKRKKKKEPRTMAVLGNKELSWVNPGLIFLISSNQNYLTGNRIHFNEVLYPGLYRSGSLQQPFLSLRHLINTRQSLETLGNKQQPAFAHPLASWSTKLSWTQILCIKVSTGSVFHSYTQHLWLTLAAHVSVCWCTM